MTANTKKASKGQQEAPHLITDKAATQLHETIDSTADTVGDAEEKVRETITSTNEKITDTKERAQGKNEEMIETVTEYVNENPVASVGIAFAAGIIASRLLR